MKNKRFNKTNEIQQNKKQEIISMSNNLYSPINTLITTTFNVNY